MFCGQSQGTYMVKPLADVASIQPGVIPISPPFATTALTLASLGLVRNDALQEKLSAVAKAVPIAGLAVVDLGLLDLDPKKKKMASVNGGKLHSLYSVGKVGVAVAAFRLREQVKRFATKSLAKTQKDLISELTKAWKPIVSKEPANFPSFPKLDRIFRFITSTNEWDIDFFSTPSLKPQDSNPKDKKSFFPGELKPGSRVCRTYLGFYERMELMIRNSNNEAASLCIEDLGYQYMRGAIEEEGFAIKGGLGFWIGGNYPRDPKLATPTQKDRFPPSPPKVNASLISGTPDAMIMLLTALYSKSLISPETSKD